MNSCEKITDQGLRNLSDGFQGLTSLESMNLNFRRNDITDQGLKSLSDGLKRLSSLKSVSLDFNG